jgi:hypothetical protein
MKPNLKQGGLGHHNLRTSVLMITLPEALLNNHAYPQSSADVRSKIQSPPQIQSNPVTTTSVYATPGLSVGCSVVPIISSLLTIKLYSLVRTTLVYSTFSPFHEVITEFDCTNTEF